MEIDFDICEGKHNALTLSILYIPELCSNIPLLIWIKFASDV